MICVFFYDFIIFIYFSYAAVTQQQPQKTVLGAAAAGYQQYSGIMNNQIKI